MADPASQQTIDMGASMETEEGLAIIDALNEVSDVLAMEGPRVSFVGEAPEPLSPAGRLQGIELYRCPRGLFLLFREPEGPHWAVAVPRMEPDGHRTGGIQSVERAIAVLKLFGESEPDLGVSELARRLKLHKSTVSRLLSTLEAGGFVQQDPRNGRYRLGLQLATLAGLALTQYDLRDVARPLLQDLATEAGETTTLSVLDTDVAVNIDQVLGPHPVKHIGWIGRRLPLHCTAAGKPLLAHLGKEVVERLLSRPLERFTEHTIVDPTEVRHELERVRTCGYAVGEKEFEADLSAVGAAVFDHRGEVVASITISGPAFRMDPDRMPDLGPSVRRTANRISARLGHRTAGVN